MAVFEVQMASASFLAAQLNALRSRRLCPPAPQQFGGRLIQIQQIEYLPNALRHDVHELFTVFTQEGQGKAESAEGLKTQVVQPIVIHVSDLADVRARPNLPPAVVAPIPCTLVLDLDYYPAGDECFLAARYARTEWGTLPPLPPGVSADQIKSTIEQLLSNSVAARAIPFTFAVPLPGGISRIDNAGLTVSRDLQRVIFRAERGGANGWAPVRWSNFYNGFVPDRIPSGRDWCLFVDKAILESTFQTLVWRAVASSGRQELRLISVGSSYSNAGGKASVDTTIYANIDLPDPLGVEYVEPVIHSELSAGGTLANTLVIDIHMPDLKQVVRDVVSEYFPGVLEYLLWPLPQIARGIAEDQVEDVELPDVPLPACTEITDRHTRCSHTVNAPSVQGLQLRFTELVAALDGVLLTGPLRIAALGTAPLDVTTRPFAWAAPAVSCGVTSMATIAWFHANGREAALAQANVFLATEGTAPAYLCDIEVVDDPHGAFPDSAFTVDSPQLPTRITIRIPNPSQAYRDDPYPLRLLVRTTIGTRLVELPAVPALTDRDLERMLHELLGKLGMCYRRIAPWFKYPRGFNPAWHVDPPWDARVDHRWRIRINGLQSSESASVVLDGGRPLATVMGREGRSPVIDLVVPPAASDEIGLIRHGESDVEGAVEAEDVEPERAMESLRERGLDIAQQLLWHAARVPAGGRLRRTAPSTTWVRHGALLVLEDSVRLLDLTNPYRPVPAGAWRLRDPRVAFDFHGRVLAATDEGLWRLDAEGGNVTPLGLIRDSPPLVDAAPGNGVLYVLTPETLELRDLEGRVLSRQGVEGGRSLIALGRHLAAAGAHGVTMWTTAPDGSLRGEATTADVRAVAVREPPDGEADSVLAVLEDGSARLLALRGERLEETASFSSPPWSTESARIGPLLVRPVQGGTHLDIGLLGEEHLVAV